MIFTAITFAAVYSFLMWADYPAFNTPQLSPEELKQLDVTIAHLALPKPRPRMPEGLRKLPPQPPRTQG